MLVGAAKLLCAARDRLPGTVMFMFQPGEEGHHGARFMLEDGIIDRCPTRPLRSTSCPTPRTAFLRGARAIARFVRRAVDLVKGAGGHASMPHDAIDPIPVACAIVTAIRRW